MFQKLFPRILKYLPQIIAMLFLAGFLAFAWQEPSQAPPGGNVEAPLNVGPDAQSKTGRLSAPELYDTNDPSYYLNPNNLSVLFNLVNKGNTTLEGDIKIKKNGVECSVYADCDNDGKTYFSGDCDESCSNCHTGTIALNLVVPDGKDQDCNGKVDDLFISALVCPPDTDCSIGPPAFFGEYIKWYGGTINELCNCFGYNRGEWRSGWHSGWGETIVSYCGKTAKMTMLNPGNCIPDPEGGGPGCVPYAACWNEYIR